MNAMKGKEIKTRKKNERSDFSKALNVIRKKHTPLNVIEVEIEVLPFQDFKMRRIGEHLRVIRNTVLGELYKNYVQMVRTKTHKRLLKRYRSVSEKLSKNPENKKMLEKEKSTLKGKFTELRELYNVTFDFARNYGSQLKDNKYTLPDAVTVLSVCEMAWKTIEKILYSDGKRPYFYKREDLITFQGKQAERCIILKYNKTNGQFHVSHSGMNFPLLNKQND
jgi:hypothetical protein